MDKLTAPIYDLSGKNVGTIDLDPTIFGVPPKPHLIQQAIVSYLANRRAATAHTKDRGEVMGTNKKPWRQKGTGSARVGSARSPIWRGGGITFGPRNERNFTVRFPQKMRQGALKSALSTKVTDGNLIIVDSLTTLDGKTKTWVAAAASLPNVTKGALIIDGAKNAEHERSIRNIKAHKYAPLEGLTTYDVVRFPSLIITKEALEGLSQRLATAVKVGEAV